MPQRYRQVSFQAHLTHTADDYRGKWQLNRLKNQLLLRNLQQEPAQVYAVLQADWHVGQPVEGKGCTSSSRAELLWLAKMITGSAVGRRRRGLIQYSMPLCSGNEDEQERIGTLAYVSMPV